MTERTLILLKPDCMERRLAGAILSRFEQKGFRIVGMKLMQATPEIAAQHYAEHVEKSFYPNLLAYITSDPVTAICLEGRDVVSVVRKMVGATKGYLAEPGTIRGDFSISGQKNLVHASDSPESATREIAIFFRPEELVSWKTSDVQIFLSPSEIAESC
ncbi:MAG: nucleoside-diphosphate kinase [Planctomycetia bacterium]|nr:nucleoside-diphosphate kinase [Planctomycetia bacterium]